MTLLRSDKRLTKLYFPRKEAEKSIQKSSIKEKLCFNEWKNMHSSTIITVLQVYIYIYVLIIIQIRRGKVKRLDRLLNLMAISFSFLSIFLSATRSRIVQYLISFPGFYSPKHHFSWLRTHSQSWCCHCYYQYEHPNYNCSVCCSVDPACRQNKDLWLLFSSAQEPGFGMGG